jgi:uncharacterized membrane protein YqiK
MTWVDREDLAEAQRAAAQSEAERVTRNAETARVDAQSQADRLKRENDARTAAGQAEADRLRRQNDAQRASAQAQADRLKHENDARTAAARGEAVRNYLTEQGLPQNSVRARGFGETQPTASNQNAAGRQQDRRVELVVSGDIIGAQTGSPTAAVR